MQELTTVQDAVSACDGQPITTSLKIAEVFGKNHKDVLRAIERLDAPATFNQRNFAPVEYVDQKGETRPMYNMTRDGFVLLAMGFTGKRALEFKIAYIEAFNAMEQKLRERNDDAKEVVRIICRNMFKSFNETCDAVMRERPVMCNGMIPPTVEDVREYCEKNNLHFVSPEKFVSYYTARNWTQGTNAKPIFSWLKVVEQWNARASLRNTLNA